MDHASSQISLGKRVLLLPRVTVSLVFPTKSLVGAYIESVNDSMMNRILIAPMPLSNRVLAQRARLERQQQNGKVARNVPFHIGDELAVSVAVCAEHGRPLIDEK